MLLDLHPHYEAHHTGIHLPYFAPIEVITTQKKICWVELTIVLGNK
jgi:hypothetical protein